MKKNQYLCQVVHLLIVTYILEENMALNHN